MARTQHLPRYQSVFVYIREVYRVRAGYSKSIKHDLGQVVCQSSIKLLKCVVAANGAIKKDLYLNRLLLEVEVQWVLLRLLYELKAVSTGQFKVLSERLAEITKQSQAWSKWVQAQGRKNVLSTKKTLAGEPQAAPNES